MPFDTLDNYAKKIRNTYNQTVEVAASNINQAAKFVDNEFNNLINSYSDSLDGAADWVKKFVYGEFADDRPVSVIVSEMLVGFVPGTVLIFSARDAVAVASRMITNPKKQEDLQEWMLLGVYLLPFVLVGAAATTGAAAGGAGGAVAGGVGAAPGAAGGVIIGGTIGSEIGNVAKCVGLFMIQKTPQLATIVNKLNKFMKGNVISTLKKLKFTEYADSIIKVITLLLNQLLGLVKRVKEVLSYGAKINWMGLGWAKSIYDRMVKFEVAITSMIQKCAIKIKQAFKEFDEHLQKIINQSTKSEPVPATVGVPVRPVTPPTTVVRPSLSQTAQANAAHGAGTTLTGVSGGGKPPQNVHQPQAKGPVIKKMKETKVGCFNPVNTDSAKKNAAKMIKENHPVGSIKKTVDQYLKDETDWQLANQQKGLNEMSVDDYLKGRDAFDKEGRGGGSPAATARKKYEKGLVDKYTDEYIQQNPQMSAAKARNQAKAKSGRIMNEMAALHNPDQIAAGVNKVGDGAVGLKNTNSSIGSQWKTRVQVLDDAAKKVPVSERNSTGMNAKLERCK